MCRPRACGGCPCSAKNSGARYTSAPRLRGLSAVTPEEEHLLCRSRACGGCPIGGHATGGTAPAKVTRARQSRRTPALFRPRTVGTLLGIPPSARSGPYAGRRHTDRAANCCLGRRQGCQREPVRHRFSDRMTPSMINISRQDLITRQKGQQRVSKCLIRPGHRCQHQEPQPPPRKHQAGTAKTTRPAATGSIRPGQRTWATWFQGHRQEFGGREAGAVAALDISEAGAVHPVRRPTDSPPRPGLTCPASCLTPHQKRASRA